MAPGGVVDKRLTRRALSGMGTDTTRQIGQLIKIETDRRLGHEWDEWDGTPLDNGGDFRAPVRLYFGFTAAGFVLAAAVLAGGVFLLAPRLGALYGGLPGGLYYSIGGGLVLALAWLGLIAIAVYSGRAVLPERLAERGLLLQTLHLAWRTGTSTLRMTLLMQRHATNGALR